MIGLTLSGGGFRATLFHLGVVRFLHDIGQLKNVSHICAVSGGSVLAAHLVLNWEEYTRNKETFDRTAADLVAFIRRDVRGKLVRRWMLSFLLLGIPRAVRRAAWTRNGLLQRAYHRLYAAKPLAALRPTSPDDRRPELHILSTSLTTGALCSFNGAGIWLDESPTPRALPLDALPVSLAVAASSAFPPLFPPVEVSSDTLICAKEQWPTTHYLTDGGVFDNLGIRRLLDLTASAKLAFDCVIISDAQRRFEWNPETAFGLIVDRATRSTDVMMERVGTLEYRFATLATQATEDCLVRCRLQDDVKADSFGDPLETQHYIQRVRTDLDEFSTEEIDALVRQGYLVARQAWKARKSTEQGLAVLQEPPWTPIPVAERGRKTIAASCKRELRLFRLSDPLSWISLVLLAAFASLLVLPYLWHRAKSAEQTAKIRSLEQEKNVIIAQELAKSTERNATAKSQHLFDVLRLRRKPDGYYGSYQAAETWTTGQAIYALCLSAQSSSEEHVAQYTTMIEARFKAHDFDSDSGAWTSDTFRTSPGTSLESFKGEVHSTPALWMLMAIAVTKVHDDGLPNRPYGGELATHYRKVADIAKMFEGKDGGWRMYLTDGPYQSNTFSTCYGTLGLLEARKAGLRYAQNNGDENTVIGNAITWFDKHFVDSADYVGWTDSGQPDGNRSVALTCHAITVILRAKAAGFAVPDRIVDRVPSIIERELTPTGKMTMAAVDKGQFSARSVHFLQYPWALTCCAEYVKLLEKGDADIEKRIKFRTILHDLVVGVAVSSDDAGKDTYKLALALQGLAAITN